MKMCIRDRDGTPLFFPGNAVKPTRLNGHAPKSFIRDQDIAASTEEPD